MIHTGNPLTLSLATAFGAYMLAAGIGGLTNTDRWTGILDELRKSPALTFIAGLMAFVLGVAFILAHNRWGDPLAAFISLIGWISALKGLVFVINPEPGFALADQMLEPQVLRIYLAVITGLGALLVVIGLTGNSP
ncbi:MAG: hypothetical protein KJ587_19185 [Alphaproteobacteria bacterium]|nr:hypothetical protein [Alphaproteobacteria bacterium]